MYKNHTLYKIQASHMQEIGTKIFKKRSYIAPKLKLMLNPKTKPMRKTLKITKI